MKKRGFTIVEGLVSMLIMSAIIVAVVYIANGYYKQTYLRDKSFKGLTESVNVIEDIKANVKTLNDLYDLSNRYDMKIIAVGLGEVKLTQNANGNIIITKISDECYGFSQRLRPNNNLFRIEVGGKTLHSKLITIIRLEGT